MTQLMYYDTATSQWLPVVVGAQGLNGPQGLQGSSGSAGTSAYAVYVPAKPYGSASTASVSIPAGTYLYETPTSVATTFSMNGQSKSGAFGTITTATASTTIAINSATGYASYSFSNSNYSIASDGTTYLVSDNQTRIWRSTDLVNWTAVSLQPQVYYGYATQIVYGNGVFVAGWRYNGQNRLIATSTDAGLTWTFQDTPLNYGFEYGQQSTQLIFDGTQFVGQNGNDGSIYTSLDGATWTYQTGLGTTQYYGNLSYVGGKYFSWNYNYGVLYVGTTPSNLNETTATFTSDTPNSYVYASPVQYANSTYYWACFSQSSSTIFIYSSSDGLNWSVLRTQNMSNQYTPTVFVADGNQILFIDSQGNAVFSSDSGSTWTYASKYFRYGAYYGKKINGVWYYSAEYFDGSSYLYPIYYNSVPIAPQQPTYVKLTSTYTAS